MADTGPNLFQQLIEWVKNAASWAHNNLGDPAIAGVLRADLGLKPGAELSEADRLKLGQWAKDLDAEQASFEATAHELLDVIEQFKLVLESVRDPNAGQVTWDVLYLILNVALADTLRLRYPALHAVAKASLLLSAEADSIERFDPAALMRLLRGEVPQDASQRLAARLGALISAFPPILDWVLSKCGQKDLVDYFYGWEMVPGPPTPEADRVSSRTLTMLLGPKKVGLRGAITVATVPSAHGGPGMVLSLSGDFKRTLTAKDPPMEIDFQMGGASALTMYIPLGDGGGDFRAEGDPSMFAKFGLTFKSKKPGKPAFTIGGEKSSRLEFGKVAFGVDMANDRFGTKFKISDGALVVAAGEADSFLRKFISDDIKVGFDIGIKVDSKKGFSFEGGSGLKATVPIQKTVLNAVTIQHLTLALAASNTPGRALALEASSAFSLNIGPFRASVDRIGMLLDMGVTDGNLGLADLAVGFKPPNGIGLVLDAAVIKGGGYLYIDTVRGEYAGALELKIDCKAFKLGIKAIGVLTTRMPDGSDGFALLLMIYGQFPPVQLSWGFTLTGVGGMIGINHGANVDALFASMSSGGLDDILFPANPVGDAPRIINRFRTVFPVTPRALLFGPMFELGWGTPNIVTIRLGVIVQLDNVFGAGPISFARAIILGQLLKTLPPGAPKEAVVLKLLVDFVGTIELNPFRIGFVARLRDSYAGLAPMKVDFGGMLVVQAVFGERPSFVLAAGGFHPEFRDIPPGVPSPIDRIFSSFPVGLLKARLEAYFATTPASIQAGAKAMIQGKLGPVEMSAQIGFDAICYLVPVFRFDVKVYGSAAIKFKGHRLAGVAFEFRLEGPGRWRMRGFGRIEILFWDVEIPFDESWGEDSAVEQSTTNAQALMQAQVADPGNWAAQMPQAGEPLINLARIEGHTGLLAHPLGTLTFTQRALPFDLALERVGSNRVEGPNRFTIDKAYVGQPSQARPAEPLQQHFAIGEYRTLSDAAKLAEPGFQALTAGCRFGSDGYTAGTGAPDQDMEYETLYLEPEDEAVMPFARIRFRERFATMYDMREATRHARQGAAGLSALRADAKLRPAAPVAITVVEPPLAMARTDTLAADGPVLVAAARRSSLLASDIAATRGAGIQVVEQFELA